MLQIKHRFPAHAATAAAARRDVEGLLAGSSPGRADDARIVVSELVTHSIAKAQDEEGTWIDLTLKVSRNALRIEVTWDQAGLKMPATIISKEEVLSDASRFIVERLAEEWGTTPDNEVWAVLPRYRGEDRMVG
jgi:2-keto-4-pentenoate hydratase